jgi:hypothetical protein
MNLLLKKHDAGLGVYKKPRLLDRIKTLEKLEDIQRFEFILDWMKKNGLKPEIQKYPGGQNIILPSSKPTKIAIASHYDTIPSSPGANDNASAITVCLEIAKRNKIAPLKNIGLEVYFFDEEEKGLQGSMAFLQERGIKGLLGLMNLEMTGMGDQFALWPIDAFSKGSVLESFESVAKKKRIKTGRYDKIVMNNADHDSFRAYGLKNSFTITCISEKDVEVAKEYYHALKLGMGNEKLYEIINQAPIFKHYHKSSDKSGFLSESSLNMTTETIWETLKKIDHSAITGVLKNIIYQ